MCEATCCAEARASEWQAEAEGAAEMILVSPLRACKVEW